MLLHKKKIVMPQPEEAPPGREQSMPVASQHHVSTNPLRPPYPQGMEMAMFGMGCFWGAERIYWETPGVFSTAVGYAGGYTLNPNYQEVCTGMTDHNEVVRVIFDPEKVSYEQLLKIFWESHDPTQGMRQGNDAGTQYRSGIYTYGQAQGRVAEVSKKIYQGALAKSSNGRQITTELLTAPEFYYAEDYHQQYLAKNPQGYCGLGGTGIACPTAVD